MTLFITTKNRLYEINDFYVMVLSFLIFFAVGKIFKAVVEKLKTTKKNVNLANPRGGNINFGVKVHDDEELAYTILTCIADNQRYLVKDPEITKMVFSLVKAKIENQYLVLTPNLMRLIALRLIRNDQTLLAKFGNVIASSNNRARLVARASGSAVIGFMAALFSTFPYAILVGLFNLLA